jgi:hypothetical protein
MLNATKELKKWAPVLEHTDAPAITDSYKKAVTAKLLENTEKALQEERAQASFLSEDINSASKSQVATYDPVIISLVRRAMPNLIAYDVAGVQPMSGPTGLIFAMKSRYADGGSPVGGNKIGLEDTEAFFNEADTGFSGDGTHAGAEIDISNSPQDGYTTGTGRDVAAGEGDFMNNMGFTIEKSIVTAQTRGLKAEYTMELAQDLKAIHGLDAESELANILSTEILAEINREIIRGINTKAELGARTDDTHGAQANRGTDSTGTFDLSLDADGRWSGEKYKSLLTQIELEANTVALRTRRGKGNFLICSSNVASALAATGSLDYKHDALSVDDTGSTFAGTIGGMKVYIDPYALADYATVGYRGSNPYDAGMFYCPYVPLTMVRAVDESTFQPKIGFKTRYGLVANPFANGDGSQIVKDSLGANRANRFFRIFRVKNINVEDAPTSP